MVLVQLFPEFLSFGLWIFIWTETNTNLLNFDFKKLALN